MARHATVGVHNDFSAGQATITHWAPNHELAGRVDVPLAIVGDLEAGEGFADIGLDNLAHLGRIPASVEMLGRQHDGDYFGRLAVDVADSDLALRVRAELADSVDAKTLKDEGDRRSHDFLMRLLADHRPHDAVLSEEGKDDLERLGAARVWIVDPLDGTREFGEPPRTDWAVHVALAFDGACALGAVALPSLGRIYYGVAQAGSLKSGVVGSGEHTIVQGDSPASDAPRIAVSRSHTPEWVDRFASSMGGTLAPAGSAGNKVAMLLAGDADMYVHKIGLKEWDTCAPETIALSAGWHVCRLDGTPHVYNQRDPKNHELVVCRPSVTERVLSALREAGALEDRLVN